MNPVARSSPAALVRYYADGPADRLPEVFAELAATVWDGRRPLPTALASLPPLVDALRRCPPGRRGRLAVLLGLLLEAEHPATGGPLTDALTDRVGLFLELLRAEGGPTPTSLALCYLLAHFPREREAVLAAADDVGTAADDRSRLARCLTVPGGERPVLGRVWPSPSAWSLTDEERAFDRAWTDALSPEQVTESWDNDTTTVLAYMGARAYWAACHGMPAELPAARLPDRELASAPAAGPEVFARHTAALRCPSCRAGSPVPDGALLRCEGCGRTSPVAGGIADLSGPAPEENGVDDLLERLSRVPSMGLFYEAVARPNFLRVAGSNWDGRVGHDEEDRFLADHVRPVAGPVLDLAAGAGRWTAVLARLVGEERVIAVDSALPMLSVLRGRLPGVPALLADAVDLPLADASVGAVVCWNALQAFYDDAERAVAEIGRVLRPGGSLTLLTFRFADDPVYRYFQAAHRFPQHADGLRLFDPADLRRWLSAAGLRLRHESAPGTFLMLSAVRAD
ncbi:class I SAM-dependent methyltransferase [Streptomyces spiramenti]|uniref:Class I SAM-dependent methyltransferase n=1 Tax=Streptomyces spiramenti TaxID=2720606 RepID=A0ABX1AI94_9ACTN|nr:class I SAM-dependent methyltransferase [Streptomyces spiramenti]NJP65935.1 class I SAM-dependent methyltransferase [Streptomyces spiramenti]